MPMEFITKRPHNKSRGGCQTCKAKKVKCDEARPKCTYCGKKNLECLYIVKPARSRSTVVLSPPSSSSTIEEIQDLSSHGEDIQRAPEALSLIRAPQPTIRSATGVLSLRDLRLMHHWSTHTWNSIALADEANAVLLYTVPQLAFESEYLLYCILGITSQHLEYVNPTSRENQAQTVLYRVKALKGFREALARANSTTLNWEAAAMTSALLLALCPMSSQKIDGGLTVMNWLMLFRGLSATIMLRDTKPFEECSILPFLQRNFNELRVGPILPKILVALLEAVHESDSDFQYLESYHNTLEILGNLYASLSQDGLGPALFMRIISWPTYLTPDFVDCVEKKRPRALIILAYFLSFHNLIDCLWWLENTGSADIKAIAAMVGTDWLGYMSIPLQATTIIDKGELARLLLRESV